MDKKRKFSLLAIVWMVTLGLEFIIPSRSNKNIIVTTASFLYRLTRRVLLLVLAIINVFLAIDVIDNKENDNE